MLLYEKGYDKKYNLGTVQMFVVEGIERVREVIEKNHKRRKYPFCSWERKKENDQFRKFNHRGSDKVYKEFMLYAIGRNINKYHRFLSGKIKKFKGKVDEHIA